MPEITGPHLSAHRRGEDVDNLLGLSGEQVCSQDASVPSSTSVLYSEYVSPTLREEYQPEVISFFTRNLKP
jgi:hypothetical protein